MAFAKKLAGNVKAWISLHQKRKKNFKKIGKPTISICSKINAFIRFYTAGRDLEDL